MEPIVEKIKALLRLSRSANRHEAELALQRAFALARKHQIDVTALDPDEQREGIGHEYFPHGRRTNFLQSRCLNLVCRFFHVEVCISVPRILFVGTPTDVTIAHYVYGFLCQQGRRGLREFEAGEKKARRKMSQAKRENYVQGFAYGIAEQLREGEVALPLDERRIAIVAADQAARRRRLDELVPNTRAIKREVSGRRQTALVSGWIQGQQTKITQPLNGTGRETRALC
jgi:hypothetical protein